MSGDAEMSDAPAKAAAATPAAASTAASSSKPTATPAPATVAAASSSSSSASDKDEKKAQSVTAMAWGETAGGAKGAAAAAAPGSSVVTSLPWVEKHRPQVLGDVVGNEDTVKRLRVIAKQGNMPNIILSGPPGTGKTTSVLCLAHELLGAAYKNAVLELNASDARGIDVVRDKIKMFAQKKVTLPKGRHKIIVLDEADSMTTGAQQALRRTMEKFSSTTRFALACNTSSKIIEPIQSRCAILRYTRLSDEQVSARLQDIMRTEKVLTVTDDGVKALLFTAQGDMRHAINNLQATYSGLELVNADNVFRVVDQPHPIVIKTILTAAATGDIAAALSALQGLWAHGYSSIDIISTIFRVAKNLDLPEGRKLKFIKEIGFTHMRIADGVTSMLQLTGLLARLSQIAD